MDWLNATVVAAVLGPLVVAGIISMIGIYSEVQRLDTESTRHEKDIQQLESNQAEIRAALARIDERIESGFKHTGDQLERLSDQVDSLQRRGRRRDS